uniref:Leucine rich repeat containing 27 n=1 Tax=Monodelphis domestica TaxID=13616 RepID=K7E070_MONDO
MVSEFCPGIWDQNAASTPSFGEIHFSPDPAQPSVGATAAPPARFQAEGGRTVPSRSSLSFPSGLGLALLPSSSDGAESRNLKTLLMEKNPIKSLPVELGNLMSLKALNLRNCPLEFPPQDVVQKGLVAILAFLRTWALKHVVDAGPLYQEIVPMKRANSFKESSKGKRSSPERPASTKEALPLWRPRPEAPKGREYSFPPVEKLNLADVGEPSMDFSEDWANEEEMKQFWKLRQEIVANEKAEILANQLLPVQFPLELGEALPNRRGKERPQKPRSNFRIPLKRPHNPRKKISSFKNMFPEIPSYETAIQTRKDEDRRVAALKELKEKQALIEQRKRDKKMLQKWREQAAAMKKEKEALMTVQPPPMDLVLMNAPFATDPLAEKKELDSLKKKQLNQWKLRPEKDELRLVLGGLCPLPDGRVTGSAMIRHLLCAGLGTG